MTLSDFLGEDTICCEICKERYKLHLLGEEGAVVENKVYKVVYECCEIKFIINNHNRWRKI